MRVARIVVGLVIVAGAAAVAVANATYPAVTVTPGVLVISHADSAGATGQVVIKNAGAPVTVDHIRAVCEADAPIALTVTGGGAPFSPTAAGTAVSVTCPFALRPGLHRCTFTAADASDAAIVEWLTVCQTYTMPTLTLTPSAYDFGPVPVGGSAITTPSIGLQGDPSNILLQLDDPDGNFELAAPCATNARSCSTGNRSGFASVPIDVLCKPKQSGLVTARLYATQGTAFSGGAYAMTPVQLACTGVAAGAPVISVVPTAIDVSEVAIDGGVAKAQLHVRNAGTGTLKITGIAISDRSTGAAADWTYSVRGACTGPISTATPCAIGNATPVDIDVAFAPTGAAALGRRPAVLQISYNDGTDRSLPPIPLDGTGTGGTVEPSATTLVDLGDVPVGTTRTVGYALINRGQRMLTDVEVGDPGPPFAVSQPTALDRYPAMGALAVSCHPTSETDAALTSSFHVSSPTAVNAGFDVSVRCRGRQTLFAATPGVLDLGELASHSTPSSMTYEITLDAVGAGAPVMLDNAVIDSPVAGVSLTQSLPAPTPSTLTFSVDLSAGDRDLATTIIVTPRSGAPIRIPVFGHVVTPALSAQAAAPLGTFCVGQPTSRRTLVGTSTGDGAVDVPSPIDVRDNNLMLRAFDALPVSLTPTRLRPTETFSLEVQPRRQSVVGTQMAFLGWAHETLLTATFIDSGGAISPPTLQFGRVPIHLDRDNAQSVTVQNCDATPITIDMPALRAPFSIASAGFPLTLAPNDVATIMVSFHPTALGAFMDTLTITSPQLPEMLTVELFGDGVNDGTGGDDQPGDGSQDDTSFYACGGCSSDRPGGGLAISLALALALRRRRR